MDSANTEMTAILIYFMSMVGHTSEEDSKNELLGHVHNGNDSTIAWILTMCEA